MTPATPVTLNISWEDLFGRGRHAMSEEQRRARWEQWLELCRNKDAEEAQDWADASGGCKGCDHLVDSGWCGLMSLPATYSPFWRDFGMACNGASHTQDT